MCRQGRATCRVSRYHAMQAMNPAPTSVELGSSADAAVQSASQSAALAALLERLRAGDVRALARAISLVEDGAPEAAGLLAACFNSGEWPRSEVLRIGFTGAPGAGKSTLVDQVARLERLAGRAVGVVAVDPTSPYTGGAILGDRIRMNGHFGDAGLYVRSMATRGFLGGLARTTADVCAVMDASGKESILIETVGVGQDEVDIVRLADITVVMLVPGMGDDVQSLKAGIMEVADIFVVNKSDREGADRVEQEIRAMQSLGGAHGAWVPPVVRTVASTGDGVDALMGEIGRYGEYLRESGELLRKRTASWKRRLVEMLRQELMLGLKAHGLGEDELEAHARAVAEHRENPYELVRGLAAMFSAEEGRSPRGDHLGIDHLGIAVRSIAQARAFYEVLGLTVEREEVVEQESVRVAMLPVGDSRIELLEPTVEDSPVGKFIVRRGEGLHHVALHVEDIRGTFERLRAANMRLVKEEIGVGAGGHSYFFVHPSSAGGVLVEICGDRDGLPQSLQESVGTTPLKVKVD